MSRLSVASLIAMVESVLLKMEGNTNFVTPNPDLAEVAKLKDDLKDTAALAAKGSKAAKALVPVKRRTLELAMYTLKSYVQSTSNSSPETAFAVAESSGMGVKTITPRKARVFSVKNMEQEGQVKVICPRDKGDITFEFAYTNTPSIEASFINTGFLPKSSRIISALIVGAKYTFRYRIVTKDGTSDWSDVITIIVT